MNWYKTASKCVGVINQVLADNIDFQMQDTNYTCGEAMIQNLYRLLGKEIPAEDELKHVMRATDTKGTAPQAIESYLSSQHIPFAYFHDDTTLDSELAKNRVVLAEFQDYQNKFSPERRALHLATHYGIIIGYDDNFYYCVDSFLPKAANTSSTVKKILKQKFHQDWVARSYDGSKLVHQWGLIVQIPTRSDSPEGRDNR